MAIELSGKDTLTPDIEAGLYTPLKLEKSRFHKRRLLHAILGLLVVMVALYTLWTKAAPVLGLPLFFALFAPAPVVPVEVFEIIAPLVVPATAYQSSYLLFNETALESGLSAKFKAPAVFNFTQGFMTLNFSVDALAETLAPQVVELTVDGTPIWRSSTPFANADTAVFTSTTKNITDYLSLFHSKAHVEFAVLEGSAPVSVSLELVLFNDTTTAESTAPAPAPVPVSAYFAAQGPASLVVPLQKLVVELPASPFSVELPQLASNVTAARISLFASASKDEVEFYKNDIAALGEPVTKNGPVRQLNVFVGDIYVGTVSPKPTLFHADKLTADAQQLWSPLADSGSFSGFTYDLDLVAVLPLLWEGPQTLSIALVSPVDTANKVPGVPALAHPVSSSTNLLAGSWFVSGSLLAWENPLVQAAAGAVILTNSSQLDLGVAVAPPAVSPWQPKISNQIVRLSIKSLIELIFNFTLLDNSTVSYNVVANSSAVLVLTKNKKESKTPMGPPGTPGKSEDTTKAFYIGSNKFKLDIQDPLTNLTVFSKSIKTAYPLTIDESTKETPALGPSSTFSAKISIDIKTKIDAVAGPALKIDELVTLDDLIGASTDIKVKVSEPGSLPFSREVQAVNGTVVKDLSFGAMDFSGLDLDEDLMGYF